MRVPRRARFRLLLVLLMLAALAWSGAAVAGDESETIVEGELGRKIDAAVQRATGGGFWGSVLVARKGEILLAKGYGFADYEGRPNRPDTLFEIASTSKQFVGAAILRLEMDGKLKVSDPISKFLRKVPEDKQGITVHHLLAHTSGIRPDVGIPYASKMTRDQMVAHVLEPELKTEPGTAFAYCNFGYALLAAIVEKASKTSFEKYLKRKIFKPAGLVDTGFIGDKSLDRKRDTVRHGDGVGDWTALRWWWGWGYRGMGGVVSTVHDMYRWDRALREYDLLDADAQRTLYAPVHQGYACGWRVDTTARGTRKVHHSGGVMGYACQYARYLEDDVVIVVLSNGKTNIHAVEERIAELLFPRPVVRATFDILPYSLSAYRGVELPGATRWRARMNGGDLSLVLHDPSGDHNVADVRLPIGPAKKLLSDLDGVLSGRTAEGPKGMAAGVYLVSHKDVGTKFELEKTVRMLVLPRYRGRGEDGKTIVEERIVLVLIDDAKGSWPIMTKMDGEIAAALRDEIREALEGFEKSIADQVRPPR